MTGQSPRELKRLLNNHRLMRVLMDIEGVLHDDNAGKAVLWAFLCWRFGDEMHRLLPIGKDLEDMVRQPNTLQAG